MSQEINNVKQQFLNNAKKINREGIDELLAWLETTDFYEAPASTQYHHCLPQGLVVHAIETSMVADLIATTLKDNGIIAKDAISDESLLLTSLFFNVFKINTYKPDTRNTKVNGKWESVPYNKYNPEYVLGKSQKSLYYLQKFIKLTDEEAQAIYFANSFYDEKDKEIKDVLDVLKNNPLAYVLYQANLTVITILQKLK